MRLFSKSPAAVAIATFLSLYFPPAFGSQYRLCIGEFDEKCPVVHNVFGGCGSDPNILADNTCAIRMQESVKHLPYRIIHQGSHGGNRCGYEWYSIECLDDAQPPPNVPNSQNQ
jgi:hypothetical protein